MASALFIASAASDALTSRSAIADSLFYFFRFVLLFLEQINFVLLFLEQNAICRTCSNPAFDLVLLFPSSVLLLLVKLEQVFFFKINNLTHFVLMFYVFWEIHVWWQIIYGRSSMPASANPTLKKISLQPCILLKQ